MWCEHMGYIPKISVWCEHTEYTQNKYPNREYLSEISEKISMRYFIQIVKKNLN